MSVYLGYPNALGWEKGIFWGIYVASECLDQLPCLSAWTDQYGCPFIIPLRKHAYSNILKISPKPERFQEKNSDIFDISAQNIDCGFSLELPRQGGSNKYQQSMFWSRNKIMYTPVNPSFTI